MNTYTLCDGISIYLEFKFFNFVLIWLYKKFDMSVTDESYIDEMCVWRTKL